MVFNFADFYEDSNTPGFQESAKFVRDMEEEQFSHLSPEFTSLLEGDGVYVEFSEAAEIVEQHSSHYSQNESPITSDEEEVNGMETFKSEKWKDSEIGLKDPKNQ